MFNDPDINDDEWDIILRPRSKWFSINLKTLWLYRDLIWMFFQRDFVTLYKQTILGPLWYLIQPVLTALTYFVVFGKIANLSTDGLPPFVFYMSGIVMWSYFAACLTNNAEVFSKNAQLFGKVYFPRLVVPLSVALSGMVAFGIQFVLLLAVSSVSAIGSSDLHVNWAAILWVPVLALYTAGAGVGVGLIVSALTVRFRDLAFAVGFVTQLWMFATPVVYPFSKIPQSYQILFHLNPMTAPIESLRALLYGTPGVDTSLWFSNLAITSVFLLVGLILFTRSESNAMDTV
ncbi:MAG: ABC transporter permease [Betaproteobacteria bacterium]|nr:ABC transporter permease [Betaproteobacteria bacterium]